MRDITLIIGTEVEVGDTIKVVLPGVPLWNIPEQTFEAKVTEENIDALIKDADKNVEHGNAKVYLRKPQKDVLPDGRVLHSPPVHRGFR